MSDPSPIAPDTSARPRRARPGSRALMASLAGLVLLALIALAAVLPVPFIVLSPGPTFNTIGDVDGVPLVEITDTTTYPVSGALDMTTIREEGEPRSPLTVFGALVAWVDPDRAVLPRELLYGDDETTEEVQQRNAVLFSTSQSSAIAAAMNTLGEPLIEDVVVTAVVEGTPAFGVLDAGERIIAIDGEPVRAPEDVVEAVRARPIGSTLAFTVERDGEEVDAEVVSAQKPDEAGVPYIGITVGINYRAEFPIVFALDDIGGPSAGMMFSLAIVDKLTPEDLTGGGHVAGTGTIDPAGAVGAIGGIRQKLAGARGAGATVFLMPEVHCDEAAGHVPEGLTVVPVTTLQGALDALAAWRAGDPLPTCPAM
ncbi:MAG: PDZ domain-containing protein [Actinobacteria bacterium]|nr:PDZ domain-containing protein [Actinomycetota bacterium]